MGAEGAHRGRGGQRVEGLLGPVVGRDDERAAYGVEAGLGDRVPRLGGGDPRLHEPAEVQHVAAAPRRLLLGAEGPDRVDGAQGGGHDGPPGPGGAAAAVAVGGEGDSMGHGSHHGRTRSAGAGRAAPRLRWGPREEPPCRHRDDVKDADAALVNGEAPPSRHTPLDRGLILDAAVTFIDEQGLAGLTMRRLGQALGVEAMALYRYVAGKEELLDGVVDRLVGGHAHRRGGPRQPERRLAGLRAAPRPRRTTRWRWRTPRRSRWSRPARPRRPGCDRRCAAWSGSRPSWPAWSPRASPTRPRCARYRAFTSFLLGHLLLEVSTHGADLGPLDVAGGVAGAAASTTSPR